MVKATPKDSTAGAASGFSGGFAALCAIVAAIGQLQAQAPQYTVTILPLPASIVAQGGNHESTPAAINASGLVVGSIWSPSSSVQDVAALWNGTAASTSLGPANGTASYANAINASGEVAGYSYTPTTNSAVVWNGTTATVLGNLGYAYSQADAINSSGEVAGEINSQPVIWNGTTPTMLTTLGQPGGTAYGINDSGQVVGTSYATHPGNTHAVVWNGTTPTDLGLGVAYGINASGQVAGVNSASHATIWNGTTPTDLGTLNNSVGGSWSGADAINDSGEVIGMASVTSGPTTQEAFVDVGGQMYNLLNLLPVGSGINELAVTFNSLNDDGQIAAYDEYDNKAVLLTPVAAPEPDSALLLFGGGVWAALPRRRPSRTRGKGK